jgi:hypothetical protein
MHPYSNAAAPPASRPSYQSPWAALALPLEPLALMAMRAARGWEYISAQRVGNHRSLSSAVYDSKGDVLDGPHPESQPASH